jgi:hypothetical protein
LKQILVTMMMMMMMMMMESDGKASIPTSNVVNIDLKPRTLEADTGQKTCSHESCINSAWEGSRFCHKPFLT